MLEAENRRFLLLLKFVYYFLASSTLIPFTILVLLSFSAYNFNYVDIIANKTEVLNVIINSFNKVYFESIKHTFLIALILYLRSFLKSPSLENYLDTTHIKIKNYMRMEDRIELIHIIKYGTYIFFIFYTIKLPVWLKHSSPKPIMLFLIVTLFLILLFSLSISESELCLLNVRKYERDNKKENIIKVLKFINSYYYNNTLSKIYIYKIANYIHSARSQLNNEYFSGLYNRFVTALELHDKNLVKFYFFKLVELYEDSENDIITKKILQKPHIPYSIIIRELFSADLIEILKKILPELIIMIIWIVLYYRFKLPSMP